MRRAVAIGSLLAAAPVLAQDPGSRPTREFVQAAAQSDMFEMLEASSVLAESKDAGVRALAQMMLRDHGATSAALREAVAAARLAPPAPGIGGDQSQWLGALQSARGRDFDRLYVRQQLMAHRAALITQQMYAETGDTPALRKVAAAAVPVITAHLAEIERMQAALGGA